MKEKEVMKSQEKRIKKLEKEFKEIIGALSLLNTDQLSNTEVIADNDISFTDFLKLSTEEKYRLIHKCKESK